MATKLNRSVTRVSNKPLDGSWGADRGRRIVITIVPGNGQDVDDIFSLRPHGTRRAETITVTDVYNYALKSRVNAGLRLKKKEKDEKRKIAAVNRALARDARREARKMLHG